ncbi:unnamed protein product [Lupinus luteus]|uniref:Integrase catalytic domain-containing protein n=1 Tax=Lupinus luteus TaxID=3873 RepID=A0AAV1Y9G8_LUPLU
MEEFAQEDEIETETNEQNAQSSTSQSNHTVNNISTHKNELREKGNLHLINSVSKTLEWILDTGATDHVCHDLSLYQTYRQIKPIVVTLPNGNQIVTNISGSILFSKHFILTNVLYIPSFHYNLISVSKLTHAVPCKLTFLGKSCHIQDLSSLRMIGVADLKAGLYAIRNQARSITRPMNKQIDQCRISSFTGYDFDVWHNRLGHLSHEKMKLMQKDYADIKCNKTHLPCHVCHLSKQRKLAYSNSVSKSVRLFDLLHMDIWGPFSMTSTLGHRYFLTIVDDKSRFTWLYFLKTKSEVPGLIENFAALVGTQFGCKIKSIRSDNGKEFYMNEFYAKNGIEHQTSCVETPEQNGIVERKHQHILGVARSLVFQSNLPHCLWNFAVGHAVYLINKQPTRFLFNKSPYSVLYGRMPNINDLKVFGCLGYASTLLSHRRKLDKRARKCVVLGYRQGVKGYVLMDIDNHEIFLSRNTLFYEHVFPYKNDINKETSNDGLDVAKMDNVHSHNFVIDNLDSMHETDCFVIDNPDNVYRTDYVDSIDREMQTGSNYTSNQNNEMEGAIEDVNKQKAAPNQDAAVSKQNGADNLNAESENQDAAVSTNIGKQKAAPNQDAAVSKQNGADNLNAESENQDAAVSTNIGKVSSRNRQKPHYLQDYHCYLMTSADKDKIAETNSFVKYPLSNNISYHRLSREHRHFSMSISSSVEPTGYTDAIKYDCWRQAIKKELDALRSNETWVITSLPNDKKAIGCKWIFKVKYKADGSIERYKARLVAKGFTQTEGVDFLETFSPVVKMTTIRVILALASANNWHLHQLDINTAFLHGDLKENVFMRVPPGIEVKEPNQVCKLQKSIYGLRQASRQWHDKLTSVLVQFGYSKSNADYSLYVKIVGFNFTAILVYVDDLILCGNNMDEINQVKHLLNSRFSIKDLGVLKYFLGMEIARSSAGILIYQRKYALDLLQEAGMLAAKPSSTPMEYSVKLIHSKSGDLLSDFSTYRRLIGKLVYLTHSRPDLSFAVGNLSQFLSAPTNKHLEAALRVLRYLKKTAGMGIFLPSSCDFKIKGYTDSDWGACLDTRRSVSGYCFYIGNSLVSWKSKKQKTVSRSSAEAEYRAIALAACEAQWLVHLLKELSIDHSEPVVMYCDNQSALHIASNPVFHERTKHIEIDCHSVRERIQLGIIHLLPISSSSQVADIFTKSLSPHLFNGVHRKLGMIDIHLPACGGLLESEKSHISLADESAEVAMKN